MTKPQNYLRAQRSLRSAWASARSDQSLRCPHEETLGPQLPIERTAKTDQTGRVPRDKLTNFIWSLHGLRERKFVCGVWVTWPRWPPCSCMVNTLGLVCRIEDLSPTKFVQMIPGEWLSFRRFTSKLSWSWWPWPFFLRQGQICFLMLLYGKI